MSNPSIKRLDPTVVNRIAAGEVIQRPSNALKELIENSLDAGSTKIEIVIKDGGLKLLQIQDNGHGIKKEDMTIVCERYTTSKLTSFDDLSRIATYGFRGEALASISHVANVTILTKTPDSKVGYKAFYSDGKLAPERQGASSEPKICAGNTGTRIIAENLFYNVPARLKALRSPSDEYNRILDIVGRYAVHNSGIGFSCKKSGGGIADIQTAIDASTLDNIRLIHGSVASEVIPFEAEHKALGFKMNGYISNANYSAKKMALLLFINHRSVESSAIKRAIENVYAPLLPKGGSPFIYLGLEIDPANVDVNVHPTKKEVHFLNEERIIQAICEEFDKKLESANSSRTFHTQALFPGAKPVDKAPAESSNPTRVDYKLIRTDNRSTTLDRFIQKPQTKKVRLEESDDENDRMDVDSQEEPLQSSQIQSIRQPRVDVRLTSVLQLRKEIKKNEDATVSRVFSHHTLVGLVNESLAAVQHETYVYLINYNVASEELFYQIVLNEFCNMGRLKLSKPINIKEYIDIAIAFEDKKGNLPEDLKADMVSQTITETLASKSDMLNEYFSLDISADGQLIGLPMIIRDYRPQFEKLPMFLLRLGTEVDWESERGCFDGVARELAIFYCAEPPAPSEVSQQDYFSQVEQLVFPCFKLRFHAPKKLNEYLTPLTSLHDLYKVFERC